MADPNSAPGERGLFADRPLPAAPEAARAAPESGAFSERPMQPSDAAPPARSQSPIRWLVPLLLFAVIIGGIAWLVQNLPSWRSRPVESEPVDKGPDVLVRFIHPHNRGVYLALWDPMPEEKMKDEKQFYVREFEREAKGQYHFPFQVHLDLVVEIGLARKSCDCSHLSVAILPEEEWKQLCAAIRKDPGHEVKENPSWQWKSLEDKDTKEQGVKLPAASYAVIRIIWENKRTIGESLNLGAQIWARTSSAARRQDYGLRIDAVSAPPLRTRKDRVDVGAIEPGSQVTAEFVLWSPTRDHAKFKMAQDDPLFEISAKDLTPAKCAELQKQLRKEEINTRVRAAWTVTIKVHEQKGKHQLDQGYFSRPIQIDMPAAVEDLPPLVVVGTVKSDFLVGAQDDHGKINLKSFPARFGTKKTVVVSSRTADLDVASVEYPAGLKVQLIETGKRKWALHLEVPPDRFFGQITDDNLVILRSKAGRSIRIPLMGHAVQG